MPTEVQVVEFEHLMIAFFLAGYLALILLAILALKMYFLCELIRYLGRKWKSDSYPLDRSRVSPPVNVS